MDGNKDVTIIIEQVSPYAGDTLYYCRFGAGNAVVEAVHEADYTPDEVDVITAALAGMRVAFNQVSVTVDEAAAAMGMIFEAWKDGHSIDLSSQSEKHLEGGDG